MPAFAPTAPASDPAAAAVLTKALLRAAALLGVPQKDLAAIVGTSAATVSRFAAGQKTVDPASKQGELALLFLRVFRSLDALVGGRPEAASRWLHAPNAHLAGVPADRIRTAEGLVAVAEYLDAMRGTL